jgi:hypothetical protein
MFVAVVKVAAVFSGKASSSSLQAIAVSGTYVPKRPVGRA